MEVLCTQSPFLPSCLSLPFPGEPRGRRSHGAPGPHRFFSPDVQAHWRGCRQRKAYRERLWYLKANVDAIVKVAIVIEGVPVPLKGPSGNC